ncbi:type II toxin-antitoxin system VapC family toxin [Actinomyces gaoshouyii]|uniref:Ribonuclease VapC n=1 Tax=Actinomyces gaoshouyii TaxID=1960083 RepID=A0A8H9H8Y6_9ACTO|nr:type II toxin-antitoxin system VapC family toxin [Actinomyces gaoshouyii]GGO98456.1 VapC ribonuclease [Actinomyces gaoshouyii]
MIVIDTSALIEGLVGRTPSVRLLDLLAGELAAPQVIDFEVLSALRGMVLGGLLSLDEAQEARRFFYELTIWRYEGAPLAERIWELRHQYTAHDAAYLALAESLDSPVVTCDRKLDAGGHRAEVLLLPRSN